MATLLDGSLARGLALLVPEVADRTCVVARRQFLSLSEIECIQAAAAKKSHDMLKDSGCFQKSDTVYLQHDGCFKRMLPDIRRKICQLVKDSDEEHWGLLAGCGKEIGTGVNPRCVEFHEYGLHARRVCGPHYDSNSLITVDIMLSRTSDFEGGNFFTTGVRHEFEQGDALVFVSHKMHYVGAITGGTRCVLVLEFWEGSECASAHRCMNTSCGAAYDEEGNSDTDTTGDFFSAESGEEGAFART